MTTQTILRTQRLILRAALPCDVDAFHEIFTDDEAMQFWSRAPHTSIDETKQWVDSMINNQFNGVLDFVICLRPLEHQGQSIDPTQLRVIGKVGVWDGKEIGFTLNRHAWGKGYASEALDAVIQQFWRVTPEMVLKADVDPRNARSLRLLKKFGFVEVGTKENTFFTHLGWCHSVYLELRRT